MSITRMEVGPRFSQIVTHNNTVYLAGQVGNPGEDIRAQTRTILTQIDDLLAKAGSDKSKLLAVTIWLADIKDYDAMNEVWDSWVDHHNAPTRATSEGKLAAPDYRVEIIAVAAQY